MRDMKTAPMDGTRILVLHYTYGYSLRTKQYEQTGTKWSDCRWREASGGSAAHWGPWCGNPRSSTTAHISAKDALRWVPLPEFTP